MEDTSREVGLLPNCSLREAEKPGENRLNGDKRAAKPEFTYCTDYVQGSHLDMPEFDESQIMRAKGTLTDIHMFSHRKPEE